MHFEKKTLRNIFIGVIGCIVLYWILHETNNVKSVLRVIGGILTPFMLGAAIAFVLNVPMRAIEGWLKGIKKDSLRRLIALVLTLLGVAIVLTLVFLLLIPQISETVQSMIAKMPSFISRSEVTVKEFLSDRPKLKQWLWENTDIENFEWSTFLQGLITFFGTNVSQIVNTTFSAIGSITGGLVDAFIAIVFSMYCLFQKETLCRQGRKLLYAFLPERRADYVIKIMRLTNSTFSSFLSGQCIEVCILGTLFAIAMTIFRMPYVPLVSVLVAVTAFIPVVGAWVGCVFGACFILVEDPIQAVWFVVLFLVLQLIENNLIYPRVVGNSIGLSGMWVLVAVAVGGELMGVAGMFIMIPVASVLYTVLSECTNKFLAKKNIDPIKLQPQPPLLISRFKVKRQKKKQMKSRINIEEKSDN